MKKLSIVLLGALALASVALVACGGGGDDEDETPGANGTRTSSTRTSGTRTSGTPGSETQTSGTPGAETTPAVTGGSPAPGQTGAAGSSPAAGTTPSAGATPGENTGGLIPDELPTPSQAEQNAIDGVSDEDLDTIYGGDPNEPPTVVTDLPDRPADASTDPSTIAAPQPDAGGIELIIDLNASEPGIQSTRTVNVGDIIRVGVVLANVPDDGLAAFDFRVRYDIARVLAPTIVGGPSVARNPDLNEEGLGGAGTNWTCAPPGPEGDDDEPGGSTGDGDPATGRAFISCFNPSPPYQSGHLVIATIVFQAVGAGTTIIDFDDASVHNATASTFGVCGTSMPCRTATLTVQ